MLRSIFAALALAVFYGFAAPQEVSAQGVTIDWRDASLSLGTVYSAILVGTGDSGPRIASAKVVVSNSSTGSRDIECLLELEDTAVDVAVVRLPAGGFSTLALEVGGDPTSIEWMQLRCRVTSASTSGVTATWAKMTTMWVGSVSTDQD